MPTITAWHSGSMASMQTHRRRDLRPKPLSRTAEQLLQLIARTDQSGFPSEVLEAAGVRADWGWSALAQLTEAGLIERNEHGHLRATRAGHQRGRRSA